MSCLLFGAGDFKNNSRATSPREVSLSMRTPILCFNHGGTRFALYQCLLQYVYVILIPGVFHFVAKTQRQGLQDKNECFDMRMLLIESPECVDERIP